MSMYAKILCERKKETEKYKVLRRECPSCGRLMHRYFDEWYCNHCHICIDGYGKRRKPGEH